MMSLREVSLLFLCVSLNIRQSVSQLNFGYNDYNGYNNRNSFQQPSSGGCNQFWDYKNDYNGQYGLIRISRPDYQQSEINIVLTVAARLNNNYGSMTLTKSIESAVSDISQGLPLFYRVDFPIQNPLPQIHEIYYNGRLLCNAPRVSGSYVTTITLKHTLKTQLTHPPVYQEEDSWPPHQPEPVYPVTQAYVPVVTTRRPVVTQRPTTQAPRKTTTQRPFVQPASTFNSDQCGSPDYKDPTTTALVIGGMDVKATQFPWLAALYYNPQNDRAGFICGGSLVSQKLVVTAAHCIQHKEEGPETRLKAEELTFYLGKLNLETLSDGGGAIGSAVLNIHLHPEWDYSKQSYDADIAIAVLLRTITFNRFIKPICLWTSTNSFADIVGTKGVVAGWGVTELGGVSTSKPKYARIPVVPTDTCLRSHSSFNTLTTDRTFCAGDSLSNRVGGSGPCNGDSGGGFIVKSGQKWYLRGIISAAILDPETGSCSPENFSVFTDATQFTAWIQDYISRYG